jgi:hypothetical protein
MHASIVAQSSPHPYSHNTHDGSNIHSQPTHIPTTIKHIHTTSTPYTLNTTYHSQPTHTIFFSGGRDTHTYTPTYLPITTCTPPFWPSQAYTHTPTTHIHTHMYIMYTHHMHVASDIHNQSTHIQTRMKHIYTTSTPYTLNTTYHSHHTHTTFHLGGRDTYTTHPLTYQQPHACLHCGPVKSTLTLSQHT